jgi:hypothetical protein
MATCRVCSADITWAQTPQGEKVPLDDHEQRDYGPRRFRITHNTVPPVVEPIADESPLRTYVDHRTLCQQPRVF